MVWYIYENCKSLFIKEAKRVKYKRVEKTLTYLTKYCSSSGLVKLQSELNYLQKTGKENQPSIYPRQWLELKVTPETNFLLCANLLLEANFLLGVTLFLEFTLYSLEWLSAQSSFSSTMNFLRLPLLRFLLTFIVISCLCSFSWGSITDSKLSSTAQGVVFVGTS